MKAGVAEPLAPTDNPWPALKEENEFQAHFTEASSLRNVEFNGDDLGKALMLLARQAKVSLGIEDHVNQETPIKVRLENVSPLAALQKIVSSNHLALEAVGNALFVRPGDDPTLPPLSPQDVLDAVSRKPDAPGTDPSQMRRNIDFFSVGLSNALGTLAHQAGVTLMLDDRITGKVTIHLEQMTPIEAIQATMALARIESEVQYHVLFLNRRIPDDPTPVMPTAEISAAIQTGPPGPDEGHHQFTSDGLEISLRSMAQQANKSLSIDSPLTGTVWIEFPNITPLNALRAIAKNKHLAVIEDQDRITIRPLSEPPKQ